MQTTLIGTAGVKPRVAQLEGRPHLVCKTVLAVSGVLNGSNGPLYYPPDELRKTAASWNGRPAVYYHPRLEVSGCAGHPEIFNQQRCGVCFSARYDHVQNRLIGDTWIDVEKLRAIDPRTLKRIQNGEILEVSTGLFTENEQREGVHNGTRYIAIARNYRPDHLAILPDQTGACSIDDGAGLNRNSKAPARASRVTEYVEEVIPLLAPTMNFEKRW